MGVKCLPLLVYSVFVLLTLEVWSLYIPQEPGNSYWDRRAWLISKENRRMLGGDLELQFKEKLANQVLMSAKFKELDKGFREPNTFLPAWNFVLVKGNISDSPIFKIIEKMPKGANLHIHDFAFATFDYVFHNITFRPNLYVCDVNGILRLKFFDKPNDDCRWQLLSEVRRNNENGTVDERIVHQMTMFTDDPTGAYPNFDVAWDYFSQIFNTLLPLFTYRPVFEDHFYQGLLELYEDNVLYVELRTHLNPLYDFDGREYGSLEVARIYKEVADRFVKDHPDFLGVKLIYVAVRSSSDSQMVEHIQMTRMLQNNLPGFIAGFDVSGADDKTRPLFSFADKLSAVSKDIPFFFHAGQTLWNGQISDENLIDAVLLGSKRIGHGFALTKHPEILELARQKKIALEIQPIMNQLTALVRDLRNHPASLLFADNYPVVVASDDSTPSGTKGLSYDFYCAFMGIMSRRADLRALKKLAINSIEYSAMNEKEKNRALEIWQLKWDQFIEEMSNKREIKY